MQPIEQSYNREEKGLHGNNLQRDLDTGGTPADLKEGAGWGIIVDGWICGGRKFFEKMCNLSACCGSLL